MSESSFSVAVVGAGPAGLYAARQLAEAGVQVALLNRDLKPGGLAEYGIYHTKHKMKDGLRKQFRQILALPNIHYFGNVTVGENADLSLNDLRELGFDAILVTVGAQGTKWLGLPGEQFTGVYHAKDLVYYYNHLPPYSEKTFAIGKRAALIGAGNVMMDIAHFLVEDLKIDEVIPVVRRGPAEVKFSKKELETVAKNLDLQAFADEMARVAPVMQAIGQDVEAARAFILSALPKAAETHSPTRLRFDFLAAPVEILGDSEGRVCGLVIEETKLALRPDGDTKTVNTGVRRTLNVDTVIFCIGDRVDETFGLPVQWNEFIKRPQPHFEIDGNSYEAFDPNNPDALQNVFVAGWSRKASDGLVGVARKDGENGAAAVLAYLNRVGPTRNANTLQDFQTRLNALGKPIVTRELWQRIEAAEQQKAAELGVETFKFNSNEAMLNAAGVVLTAAD